MKTVPGNVATSNLDGWVLSMQWWTNVVSFLFLFLALELWLAFQSLSNCLAVSMLTASNFLFSLPRKALYRTLKFCWGWKRSPPALWKVLKDTHFFKEPLVNPLLQKVIDFRVGVLINISSGIHWNWTLSYSLQYQILISLSERSFLFSILV